MRVGFISESLTCPSTPFPRQHLVAASRHIGYWPSTRYKIVTSNVSALICLFNLLTFGWETSEIEHFTAGIDDDNGYAFDLVTSRWLNMSTFGVPLTRKRRDSGYTPHMEGWTIFRGRFWSDLSIILARSPLRITLLLDIMMRMLIIWKQEQDRVFIFAFPRIQLVQFCSH